MHSGEPGLNSEGPETLTGIDCPSCPYVARFLADSRGATSAGRANRGDDPLPLGTPLHFARGPLGENQGAIPMIRRVTYGSVGSKSNVDPV